MTAGSSETDTGTKNLSEIFCVMDWKLAGYLVSSLSVGLLGAAGWPSTPDEWRMILLVPGMAASVVGMMCRYVSHRHDKSAIAFAQEQASKAQRQAGENGG